MKLANQQLAAKVATSYIWSFFQKRTSLQEPWIAPMKQSNWVTILDRLNNSMQFLRQVYIPFPSCPLFFGPKRETCCPITLNFSICKFHSLRAVYWRGWLAATFVGHVPLHQSKYLWRRVASNQSHHLHGKTWWLLATPHLQKKHLKCRIESWEKRFM